MHSRTDFAGHQSAGRRRGLDDIFVVHSGSDHSPDGQAKKIERDLKLLALEERERPNHPFTLFNPGMTYLEMKQYELAADDLGRTIAVASPQESPSIPRC
jgi:hypothetical protein